MKFHSTDSFIEVSHFYQGYIDNEINLNSEANCRKSCDDYTITKHYHCADDTFCAGRDDQWDTANTICNGSVLNCQYMGGDLSFCLAVSALCTAFSIDPLIFAIFFRPKIHRGGTTSFVTITEMYSVGSIIV